MSTHLLTLHALSPLHCGIGQAVGAIELPIAREKPTHIPIVPGSSIKGVLRAVGQDSARQIQAFGPETANASDHAGAIQFSDARLVLLPMRSLKGVFAWTTSPYLLERLRRDLAAANLPCWDKTPEVEESCCQVTSASALRHDGKVFLDDLDFHLASDGGSADDVANVLGRVFFSGAGADADFNRDSLRKRLCILPDDAMGLVLETGTELQTHVCLDPDTKTVKRGQLWQEESLPVESLLVSLVNVGPAAHSRGASKSPATELEMRDHLKSLCAGTMGGKATLQFGGKSSVGKGVCHVGLVGKE